MSPWYYGVAERDHDLQNPTSVDTIRLVGERMRLGPGSRVLDVASGRGGPALVLAATFGCRIRCIERHPGFAAAARERAAAAGLDGLVEVIEEDAALADLGSGWDATLCLGATFVWDGLEGTLAALAGTVRPGGHLAVGEPYWRSWPLPEGVEDEGYVPLAATVGRFEASGMPVVSLAAASESDWDRYESLHWRACEEWLAESPAHPEAAEIREPYLEAKARYLTVQRALLGWAILVGWKRPATPPL